MQMSYCRQYGKDQVIFVTKEDHETPSTVTLPISLDDEQRGLILPNGEINWSCPCLGGMATGPCGVEFREAFSCFHYSKAEPKGSDCFEKFGEMQSCMSQYPTVYPQSNNKEEDEDDDDFEVSENNNQDNVVSNDDKLSSLEQKSDSTQ
ncbi:mitochondrial intermembrane space import and assembly protein 40-B [Centruroides vittatus]|uniref:mitochondrial intermembrane space import and assembly protein 40-B n=1 Tax=Centruroides vittatus TaxID=120091 RepID=UPI00350F57DC